MRPNHATKVCMHPLVKLELQQERKHFLLIQCAACRSEQMEEQMNHRSMGEGENKSEYTNNHGKRDRTTVRPNPSTKVCMHNLVKLKLQQERKRSLLIRRTACRSERTEEQMNDRSMGERENKREYTKNQCKREQTPLRPNQATSSNATKLCMENPVRLECKQERKRFPHVERAAGMSQRANGRAHKRSINERRRPNQCPNQAASSNARKAFERLTTRVPDLLR